MVLASAPKGKIYEVNWDMKPIAIISAAALFSALITVSTTTAAALSCGLRQRLREHERLME